jgi:hypothetical protein
MVSSTILTLLVIPTIYSLWRQREVVVEGVAEPKDSAPVPAEELGVGVAAT